MIERNEIAQNQQPNVPRNSLLYRKNSLFKGYLIPTFHSSFSTNNHNNYRIWNKKINSFSSS